MWPFRTVWRGMKKLFSRKKKYVARKRKAVRRRKAVERAVVVKKSVRYDRITTNGNTTNFGSDTFELADIPQYLAYANLYDKFKILKVLVTYRTLINSSHLYQSPGQVVTAGFVHSYIDTTDSVTPSSLQDMMNDSSYRITRGTQNHSRMIYPKFLNSVGSGVAAQSKSGWMNTRSADGTSINTVSHYGIKFAFEGGTTATSAFTSMIHQPIYTYWIAFKDPK